MSFLDEVKEYSGAIRRILGLLTMLAGGTVSVYSDVQCTVGNQSFTISVGALIAAIIGGAVLARK